MTAMSSSQALELNHQIICRAIEQKKCLAFYYNNKLRVTEPFVHGTSIAGRDVLRCYQYGGESGSADVPTWRLFEIARITYPVILDDRNVNLQEEGVKRIDPVIPEVHCSVW